MEHERVSYYKSLLSACAGLALFAFFMLPTSAFALQVQSQTAQLLPPGGSSCAPITITSVTPYVYSDGLNSFEFTVSDPSYVAVLASVGKVTEPLNFITRYADPSGGVRVHVDINSTPVGQTVPTVVTLLSARPGAPVCAAVVAIDFSAGASNVVPAVSQSAAPAYPTATTDRQRPAAASPTGHIGATPTTGASQASAAIGVAAGIATPLTIKPLCSSDAVAYRTWLMLLVLYAVLVGGLLWLEFPLSWTWARTPERLATIILAALVLLLGFWYFSISCRAALWMPLLAFLISILGLLAAFWNHPKVTQLLLLEEKTAIITPPSVRK